MRLSQRKQFGVWVVVALISMALLAGSLWWSLRPHATVRAMPVTSAVSDEQARGSAESTVRAWIRALNDRNVANLRALSCERPDRKFALPFTSEDPDPEITDVDAVTTGRFERDGDVWKLPVFFRSPGAGYGGRVFSFSTAEGVLRVCNISVPDPW